jgi:hypothetical protein
MAIRQRQQVLQLWLAEGALDTKVVAWAFYDGCGGDGPELPREKPPYSTGVDALLDGWCLLQAPQPPPHLRPGMEHETGGLQHQYVFERRIEQDV